MTRPIGASPAGDPFAHPAPRPPAARPPAPGLPGACVPGGLLPGALVAAMPLVGELGSATFAVPSACEGVARDGHARAVAPPRVPHAPTAHMLRHAGVWWESSSEPSSKSRTPIASRDGAPVPGDTVAAMPRAHTAHDPTAVAVRSTPDPPTALTLARTADPLDIAPHAPSRRAPDRHVSRRVARASAGGGGRARGAASSARLRRWRRRSRVLAVVAVALVLLAFRATSAQHGTLASLALTAAAFVALGAWWDGSRARAMSARRE